MTDPTRTALEARIYPTTENGESMLVNAEWHSDRCSATRTRKYADCDCPLVRAIVATEREAANAALAQPAAPSLDVDALAVALHAEGFRCVPSAPKDMDWHRDWSRALAAAYQSALAQSAAPAPQPVEALRAACTCNVHPPTPECPVHDAESLRDELDHFYEFVNRADPAIVDAYLFTLNNEQRGHVSRAAAARQPWTREQLARALHRATCPYRDDMQPCDGRIHARDAEAILAALEAGR